MSASSFIYLRSADPELKPPPGPTSQRLIAKLARIETAIFKLAEVEARSAI